MKGGVYRMLTKLQGYMADTDVRRISGLERHGEIRKGTGIAIL